MPEGHAFKRCDKVLVIDVLRQAFIGAKTWIAHAVVFGNYKRQPLPPESKGTPRVGVNDVSSLWWFLLA